MQFEEARVRSSTSARRCVGMTTDTRGVSGGRGRRHGAEVVRTSSPMAQEELPGRPAGAFYPIEIGSNPLRRRGPSGVGVGAAIVCRSAAMAAGLAKTPGEIPIGGEAVDFARQGGLVAGLDQDAANAVVNHLGDSADAAGDDGSAGDHGFQCHQAARARARREGKISSPAPASKSSAAAVGSHPWKITRPSRPSALRERPILGFLISCARQVDP